MPSVLAVEPQLVARLASRIYSFLLQQPSLLEKLAWQSLAASSCNQGCQFGLFEAKKTNLAFFYVVGFEIFRSEFIK